MATNNAHMPSGEGPYPDLESERHICFAALALRDLGDLYSNENARRSYPIDTWQRKAAIYLGTAIRHLRLMHRVVIEWLHKPSAYRFSEDAFKMILIIKAVKICASLLDPLNVSYGPAIGLTCVYTITSIHQRKQKSFLVNVDKVHTDLDEIGKLVPAVSSQLELAGVLLKKLKERQEIGTCECSQNLDAILDKADTSLSSIKARMQRIERFIMKLRKELVLQYKNAKTRFYAIVFVGTCLTCAASRLCGKMGKEMRGVTTVACGIPLLYYLSSLQDAADLMLDMCKIETDRAGMALEVENSERHLEQLKRKRDS